MAGRILLVIMALAGWAVAQTTQSALPTLKAWDRGLQEVYQIVNRSVVRVTVPVPVPVQIRASQANPDLNGAVRVSMQQATTRALEPGGSQFLPSESSITITPEKQFALAEFAGIILDDEGDVLVPMYIDRDATGEHPLRVTYGNNQQVSGKLLGSDRQTNLAVIKLDKPVGEPVKMSKEVPAMGSLVLLVSPMRRQVHVGIWTGGHDDHSVVMNSSGALAGFNRNGHFFEPYAFEPVAKQIIETGAVRRPVLGVLIRELGPEDPAHMQHPDALGNKPAARVETVTANSAAQKGGVQRGDLFLSLAGDPVNDLAHFAAAISKHSGETDLKVLRDGKEMVLKVNLQPK